MTPEDRAEQAPGVEAVAVKPLEWNENAFAHTTTGMMYQFEESAGRRPHDD